MAKKQHCAKKQQLHPSPINKIFPSFIFSSRVLGNTIYTRIALKPHKVTHIEVKHNFEGRIRGI